MTLRGVSAIKNIIAPKKSWKDFCYYVMMVNYLTEELPDEGIYIKELNMQYGGTVTIVTRSEEEKREFLNKCSKVLKTGKSLNTEKLI